MLPAKTVRILQRIVFCSTIVEAKDLLAYISIKVKWFDRDVGAAQTSLQQAPEVLNSLSMHFTTNVLFDVVHGLVDILTRCEIVIPYAAISVNG